MRQPEHTFFYHCPEQVSEMTIVVIFPVTFYKTKSFNSKSSQKLRFCGSWNFLCAFKLFVKRWVVGVFCKLPLLCKRSRWLCKAKNYATDRIFWKGRSAEGRKVYSPLHIYIRSRKSNAFLTNLIKKKWATKNMCVCVNFFEISTFSKNILVYIQVK